MTFRSDLALVLEPVHLVDFEILMAISQPVHVVMRADHPLAGESELRLRSCLDYPYVLPAREYGVRVMMERALSGGSRHLDPVIRSDSFDFMRHYVEFENVLAFQIPIGLRLWRETGLVSRPVSKRDMAPGSLLLGQMKGRSLPVAPSKFALNLINAMRASAEDLIY